MLGAIATVWADFLQGRLEVAIAVGTSLVAISILASISGSGVPFLFSYLRLDPALMSSPLITRAVDVVSKRFDLLQFGAGNFKVMKRVISH